MTDVILLEDGSSLLQETGDFILLETQVSIPGITQFFTLRLGNKEQILKTGNKNQILRL